MSQGNFPQQAIATRRQTALLSHRTYTTERRALFDAVLRLSFDLGRAEAPVPSQAWMARILGMSKGDVSRAEKALVGFGMVAVSEGGRGPDKRRIYKAQPDVSAWAGEGFAWRIADQQARALAILAECQLATCEAPDNPEQSKLPLEFIPTITEEFNLQVESAKVESAIEAAGALPTHHQAAPPQGGAQPSQFPGQCPENPSTIEKPSAGLARYLASKDRLAAEGNVGRPANEHPETASSATATKPSQGEQPLARRPTLPADRWLPGQRSGPAPGGKSLARQPTVEGNHGPSKPPGDAGVGYPANDPGQNPLPALATRPTITGPSCAGARMSEPLPLSSNIHSEVYLTSNIAETAAVYGGMENVAGPAGRMGNVPAGRAPDELLRMVFRVVHVGDNIRLINHWRRLLAPKPRQTLALDLLSEIQLRRKEALRGINAPIDKPGAWFVSEFYKRAGIPRPAHKS